jgi:hypothetical protein
MHNLHANTELYRPQPGEVPVFCWVHSLPECVKGVTKTTLGVNATRFVVRRAHAIRELVDE